ncbi:hypothetical protein PGTUg99_031534, partial [Puccinia graminis f. sp. tritici]
LTQNSIMYRAKTDERDQKSTPGISSDSLSLMTLFFLPEMFMGKRHLCNCVCG